MTERGAAVVAESHRWLAATLERIEPEELATVSASLATIADDLSSRTSSDHSSDWTNVTHALPA